MDDAWYDGPVPGVTLSFKLGIRSSEADRALENPCAGGRGERSSISRSEKTRWFVAADVCAAALSLSAAELALAVDDMIQELEAMGLADDAAANLTNTDAPEECYGSGDDVGKGVSPFILESRSSRTVRLAVSTRASSYKAVDEAFVNRCAECARSGERGA